MIQACKICAFLSVSLFLAPSAGWEVEAEAQPPLPVRDIAWFLKSMRSPENLPNLEVSHTAMASTWDRTGGNDDGLDFKEIHGTTNILLDVEGPGCLHRIFTGVLNDQIKETRIQIYLDHEDRPVFDLPVLEFYDDQDGPFPYPLVFHKSYPGLLMPIPFARHIRVQLVNDHTGESGGSLDRWGNYWQLTYTRFAEGTRVQSLSWPLASRQQDELDQTCRSWLDAEKRPTVTSRTWTHEMAEELAPGRSMEQDMPGSGTIRELRVHVTPATPEALHGTRLRITWDGAANPSVDVPVGRFWGNTHYGYGQNLTSAYAVERYNTRKPIKYSSNYSGLLMHVAEDGAFCRFPMPFEKGARVVLVNENQSITVQAELSMQVQFQNVIPENSGRFHATYRESRIYGEEVPKFGLQSIPGHVVLDRQCRGKYVGVMLHINWPFDHWWGEGDWLIWSDENSWPPSYHGTGSEEYFNSGWCQFDRKALSGFVGLRPGHPTVYSFHVNDAFQFSHHIRIVEEQFPWPAVADQIKYMQRDHPTTTGHRLNLQDLVWDSVAFWYALPAQPAESF